MKLETSNIIALAFTLSGTPRAYPLTLSPHKSSFSGLLLSVLQINNLTAHLPQPVEDTAADEDPGIFLANTSTAVLLWPPNGPIFSLSTHFFAAAMSLIYPVFRIIGGGTSVAGMYLSCPGSLTFWLLPVGGWHDTYPSNRICSCYFPSQLTPRAGGNIRFSLICDLQVPALSIYISR